MLTSLESFRPCQGSPNALKGIRNIKFINNVKYTYVEVWKKSVIFIGPESDHCLPLSVTNWLTHSCLVSFIDVTLVCEDANSKLVDVVTVADDDRLGNSLLHIWKLRFGEKAKLLFRLWAQGLVKILKLKFRQDLKLEFGQFFLLMFCRCYVESWSGFWS